MLALHVGFQLYTSQTELSLNTSGVRVAGAPRPLDYQQGPSSHTVLTLEPAASCFYPWS